VPRESAPRLSASATRRSTRPPIGRMPSVDAASVARAICNRARSPNLMALFIATVGGKHATRRGPNLPGIVFRCYRTVAIGRIRLFASSPIPSFAPVRSPSVAQPTIRCPAPPPRAPVLSGSRRFVGSCCAPAVQLEPSARQRLTRRLGRGDTGSRCRTTSPEISARSSLGELPTGARIQPVAL